MPISTALDVVLESDDIVILGPPTSIDLAVDIGPQGDRGSRFFTGAQDPNTLTSAQFETLFGYAPIYGDTFLRTDTGSNYGKFYTYLISPGGDQWQATINMYDVVGVFFNLNDTFVLSGKNGGTGVANPNRTLNLGNNNLSFVGTSTTVFNIAGNTVVTFPTSGVLATTGNLAQFASTTSAQLAGVISDETGSGSLVFATSPALTGTPTSTTAAVDTNTTQIATTAYVVGQGYLKSSDASSTYAPLASPTFTGTSTFPTLSLTTADSSATASHYIFETASDGVIRPKTLANVRTEIVTTAAVNSASATVLGTITSGVWQGSAISSTYIDSAIARLASPTFTGIVTMPTSTSGVASIKIPHGSDPTSPNDGDVWTTTTGIYVRINGSTVGPLGTGGGGGGTTNTEDVIGISFFTMGA